MHSQHPVQLPGNTPKRPKQNTVAVARAWRLQYPQGLGLRTKLFHSRGQHGRQV